MCLGDRLEQYLIGGYVFSRGGAISDMSIPYYELRRVDGNVSDW
jgi:hypothetical protein